MFSLMIGSQLNLQVWMPKKMMQGKPGLVNSYKVYLCS